MMIAPVVLQDHHGMMVARDDLIGGGTKARYMVQLFEGVDELVYATPAEGWAQSALAWAARETGKRATIFVAKRAKPHPRSLLAKEYGATVYQVPYGYLSVVQKRATDYCAATGASLTPFGVDTPEAIACIADAARATGYQPDEVWCASGSGVLARALGQAFPDADRYCVQIGRDLKLADTDGATVIKHPLKFGQTCKVKVPFPSDPHYDAKAWEIALEMRGSGKVLFWNVTGPA